VKDSRFHGDCGGGQIMEPDSAFQESQHTKLNDNAQGSNDIKFQPDTEPVRHESRSSRYSRIVFWITE
jgi:hypothetical protein